MGTRSNQTITVQTAPETILFGECSVLNPSPHQLIWSCIYRTFMNFGSINKETMDVCREYVSHPDVADFYSTHSILVQELATICANLNDRIGDDFGTNALKFYALFKSYPELSIVSVEPGNHHDLVPKTGKCTISGDNYSTLDHTVRIHQIYLIHTQLLNIFLLFKGSHHSQ